MSRISTSRMRILIVDDSSDLVEVYRMMAVLWGHEPRTAYDGLSALQIAGSFRPHVVLLDIGLPGLSGWEVARRLRQMPGLRHSFLIATTGRVEEEDWARSAEAGFDVHLPKPFAPSELQQLLEICVESLARKAEAVEEVNAAGGWGSGALTRSTAPAT